MSLVDSIALKRCGTPDEVAGEAFLCSDVASYITGSLVEVSGGNLVFRMLELVGNNWARTRPAYGQTAQSNME